MKKFTLLVMMAFLMGSTSLVLADSTTAPVTPHPRIQEVHTRMHDQMARIRSGVKSGTLTKEQAETLKTALKAVREQIQADFTTNGKKELTDDQLAQLNQMLDQNSKAIYGEKHDGATAPAPGNGSSTTGGTTAPAPSN